MFNRTAHDMAQQQLVNKKASKVDRPPGYPDSVLCALCFGGAAPVISKKWI